MKTKLIAALLLFSTLGAEMPILYDSFIHEEVKLSDQQRELYIRECNRHILTALNLLDELKDMHWYIPKRSLKEIAGDAIRAAIVASSSKSKKAAVFTGLLDVVAQLATITWDQYCEFKDKAERCEYHYDMYLFYLQVLRNDAKK